MEFNGYLQQRSQYSQDKIKEAKIEAYERMSRDVKMMSKLVACRFVEMSILSVDAIENIVDDLMEQYKEEIDEQE